jgi:hypothetical protein
MKKTKKQYSVHAQKRDPLVQETGWVERHPSERGQKSEDAPLGKPSIHAILRLLECGRK